MAFKKLKQHFVLSDSSVNVYGFRLLTDGYLMDEFLKNPIGYYNHEKADGVLLRWEDVQLDGDRVTGVPVINMEHPRAQRTITEIEEGFLNAASVGHICLLDSIAEENPLNAEEPILVGTKWYNKECSLVDSPGNRSAFKAGLYDVHDNEINLADFTQNFKTKHTGMKEVKLPITAKLISLLNLSDDATAEAVTKGIQDLHDAKDKAEKDLAGEQKKASGEKIKTILDGGLADGKFNKATRDLLEKQFEGKHEDLEALVGGMPKYEPLTDKLKAEELPKELADKSFDDLHKMGKLKEFETKWPAKYKELYKAKFGEEPKK